MALRLPFKDHYPVINTVNLNSPLSSLEMNVLQYAAGYIPRNLLPKIERSAHHRKLKESLRMCLLDIIEEDGLGDDESEQWTKLVSRGAHPASLNSAACQPTVVGLNECYFSDVCLC
jgi:hypothetical protein